MRLILTVLLIVFSFWAFCQKKDSIKTYEERHYKINYRKIVEENNYWKSAIGKTSDKKRIFENICKDIIQQNNHFILKQKLQGVIIVEEPISGSFEIGYENVLNDSTLNQFKTLSKKEQIAILKSDSIPIFPIQDTLFIVDTVGFFSEKFTYQDKNCFFIVTRKSKKKSSSPYLFGLAMRNDEFIVGFSFFNSTKYSNYYFNVNRGQFVFIRSSIISGELSIE